ncbi:NAD-dependent epimerase/dehydratase family protein [Microbulbifer harenosus]|uniref:NAD-dependent epimerase/dehydratase family protein n=1 Tax=Microbulbifer harenosus TaxID=2576840 RepID=A0ABY2UM90_9GAMM|nr:NAD-dependent epimerase/dehydratase family protein [Microbulbifer harenosus]TLM77682.1 NAD-dependent epimerase/dehydratase family protein [Microbulbifer harenosus]
MRWVIIGSSGYIGSALCRYLVDRGLPVLSVSRRGEHMEGADHQQIPEYSDEWFRGLFKAGDRIVYAAGLASIPGCRQQPELADWLNCRLPVALLELANGAGAESFLYLSSVKAKKVLCGGIACEDSGQPASDPYGQSKWRAEQRLLAYPGKIRVNVLRPAAVYGEYGGKGGVQGVHRSRAFAWKSGLRRLSRYFPFVPATGYRSFVAIDDLLVAIALLEERACDGDIFIAAEPAYYDLAAIGSAASGRHMKSSCIMTLFIMLPFEILAALGVKAAILDAQRSELYSAARLKTRLAWQPRVRYVEFLRRG